MEKRGSARLFLFSTVIVLGLVFLTVLIVSYNSPNEIDCLNAQANLSIIDSPYLCYNAAKEESSFSLNVQDKIEGVSITFGNGPLAKTVKVKQGESQPQVRGLNNNFGDPISFKEGQVNTYVYKGSTAQSLSVSPIVNGKTCSVVDTKVLDPCSTDVSSGIVAGETSSNASNIQGSSHGGGGGGSGGSGPSPPPSNQVPIAFFTTNTTNGTVPLSVLFNASLSTDPDGTIVDYTWNFGDGTIVNGTNKTIQHTFILEGVYDVVLTVTDNSGALDDYTISIDTTNNAVQSNCGNTIIDAGEQCDGTNLNGQSCTTLGQGFNGGTLSCIASGQANECHFNTSSCISAPPICGNGIIQSGEMCDDNNTINGDGCSSSCQIESSYSCMGQPSTCTNATLPLKAQIIIREADWITERKASGAPLSSRYLGTNQTNYYTPLPVFFEAWNSTPQDNIVNYSWNFGDGSTQQYGFNAAHVYETPGTYTTTLTISDKYGRSNTTSVSITAFAPNGTTYYVDSQVGDDNCDGKSQTVVNGVTCPWQTATKAFNGFKNNFYQPGDQILFKRGQTFAANVSQNGNSHWTSGWGYSFGAYGTGIKPIIKAAGSPNVNGNYTLTFGGIGLAYISFVDLRFDCTSSTGIKTVCYSNVADNQNMLFLRDDFFNSDQSLLTSAVGSNQSDLFIIDSNFYNSSVVHTFIQGRRVALINNRIDLAGNHLNYESYLDKAVFIDNIFTRPAFGRAALRIDGEWTIFNNFDGPSNNVYVGHNFLGGWVDPINGFNCSGCDPLGAHNGGGNNFNYNLINIAPNNYDGQSIQNIVFENNIATESQTFMNIGDAENITVRNNVFRTIDDSAAGRIGVGSAFDCKPSKNVNIANNTIVVNSNYSNAFIINDQFYLGTTFWSGNFTAHPGCGAHQYLSQTSHENIAYENNSILELTSPRTLLLYATFNNTRLAINDLYKIYNLSLRNNLVYSNNDSNMFYYNGTYYNVASWNSQFGTAAGTSIGAPNAYISPGLVISPIFQDGGTISMWFDYIKPFNGVNVQQIKLMVRKDGGAWTDGGLTTAGTMGTYGLKGTFDYTPSQGSGEYYFALQVLGSDGKLYPSQVDLPTTRTVYTSGSNRPGDGDCGDVGCSPLSSPYSAPACGDNRMVCMFDSFRSAGSKWARLVGYAIQESTGVSGERSPASFVLFLLTMVLFVVGLIILVNYIRK